MPYYAAGDYYRGDYYRGDNYAAGGLFSKLGMGLKKLAGSALSKATGGLVTKIPTFKKAKRHVGPGILIGSTLIGSGVGEPDGLPVPAIGMTPAQAMLGLGRRHRRINPLNLKALKRAMRRAKGFEKQARHVGVYFHPGKTYRLKGRAKKKVC